MCVGMFDGVSGRVSMSALCQKKIGKFVEILWKLSVQGTLNQILGLMAKHIGGERWKFLEEPDAEFTATYPEIAQQQAVLWDERRQTLERTLEEWDQRRQQSAADTGADSPRKESTVEPTPNPARKTPGKRTAVAVSSAPAAKRLEAEMQSDMRNHIRSTGGAGMSRGRGGRGFRGGRGGRGRGFWPFAIARNYG